MSPRLPGFDVSLVRADGTELAATAHLTIVKKDGLAVYVVEVDPAFTDVVGVDLPDDHPEHMELRVRWGRW